MKVAISKIKPSPWNPKKEFTTEDRKRLEKSLEEYPGLVRFLVCKDYSGGDGYFCLDGNSRLAIITAKGIKTAEIQIVDQVTDLKSLKKFITIYDYNRKKYKGSAIIDEVGISFSALELQEFINIDLDRYALKDQKIDIEYSEMETKQFFISLPRGIAAKCRRRFKAATPDKNGEKIMTALDKMEDEDIIKAIIMHEEENKQVKNR